MSNANSMPEIVLLSPAQCAKRGEQTPSGHYKTGVHSETTVVKRILEGSRMVEGGVSCFDPNGTEEGVVQSALTLRSAPNGL